MKRLICALLAALMLLTLASCAKKKDELNYLLLVNKENKLPDGWEEKLKTVTVKNSLGDDVEVEKKAYEAYKAMKAALAAEDVFIDLDSARRSVAEQQEIWDDFVAKYGEDYTRRTVATPGFSEHHTGLALDLYLIINGKEVVENEDLVRYTDVWAKIHAKLSEYGFILRYPQGKEEITGYSYEPWHIRYIDSPPIAKEINTTGMTLEEYLKKLPIGKVAPGAEDETSEPAWSPQDFSDDGQNPVMNFVGDYTCERASAKIAADGKTGAVVTVRWSGGADTLRQWEIKGAFNEKDLLITYSNAVVKDIAYNEDGSVRSEETVAGGSSGSIIFRNEGKFFWIDSQNDWQSMELSYVANL